MARVKMARAKQTRKAQNGLKASPKPEEKESGAGQRDTEGSKGAREMTFAAFEKLAKSKRLEMSHMEGDDTTIAELVMDPKKFSSGSYGWSLSKKLEMPLSGQSSERVQVQVSFNMTVIGSKPADSSRPRTRKRKADAEDIEAIEANEESDKPVK